MCATGIVLKNPVTGPDPIPVLSLRVGATPARMTKVGFAVLVTRTAVPWVKGNNRCFEGDFCHE